MPGAPSVNTMANSPRRGEDSRGRVRVLVMIRGHKTPTSGPLEQTMDTLCTSLSISPVIISKSNLLMCQAPMIGSYLDCHPEFHPEDRQTEFVLTRFGPGPKLDNIQCIVFLSFHVGIES